MTPATTVPNNAQAPSGMDWTLYFMNAAGKERKLYFAGDWPQDEANEAALVKLASETNDNTWHTLYVDAD